MKQKNKSITKVESEIFDILNNHKGRSPCIVSVIDGRFCEAPVPMADIALKVSTSKQHIDQIEKKIIWDCRVVISPFVAGYLEGKEDFFTSIGDFADNTIAYLFMKTLSSHFGCSLVTGGIYAKKAISLPIILLSISLGIREKGLPYDLTSTKFESGLFLTGWDIIAKIPAMYEKYAIHEDHVYYNKSKARSSVVNNLSCYISCGKNTSEGLKGIYSIFKEKASRFLKADKIPTFDHFMKIISKRSCNLEEGRIFSIDQGKWELASYFYDKLGRDVAKKLTEECLAIAEALPCETTSVYLFRELESKNIQIPDLVNYYSLKSILVYSGKFKNLKKFKIILNGKICKEKHSIKDNVYTVLSSGPKTMKEIETGLQEIGLSYTGTTIGMALADKKLFSFDYGIYYVQNVKSELKAEFCGVSPARLAKPAFLNKSTN